MADIHYIPSHVDREFVTCSFEILKHLRILPNVEKSLKFVKWALPVEYYSGLLVIQD